MVQPIVGRLGNFTDVVDVLVIGSGMAGLSAAIAALEREPLLNVALAAPNPLYSGGCSWETHAFNAAVQEGDTWVQHLRDTLVGGGFINDPRLAELLCRGAVDLVDILESYGVRFDGTSTGEHDLGTYAGSTHSRGLHTLDLTGLVIMQALVREAIVRGCRLLHDKWLVDLLMTEDGCQGAVFLDVAAQRMQVINARTTVLATGGGACVYPISSISPDKGASGIAIAMRHGVPIVDIEMVQFHPTGLVAPGSPSHGTLLEEELRTLGATLHNADGKRFMFDHDERGERATRDIVARGCYLEIDAGRGTPNGGVHLDISTFSRSDMLSRFPNSVRRLRSCGVDLLTADSVEICPTAHFLMGGMVVDENAATSAPGLYACGEDAGGIHGANRLGGNGVADALVFGRIAGRACAEDAASGSSAAWRSDGLGTVDFYDLPEASLQQADDKLRELMWKSGGLMRDASGLASATLAVRGLKRQLRQHVAQVGTDEQARVPAAERLQRGVAFDHRLALAEAILVAAAERPQTLGAHYRVDSSQASTEAPYSVVVTRDDEDMLVSSRILRAQPSTATAANIAA